MKAVLALLLCVHTASAVTHSLQYFYTASSGVPDLPEFVTVGMVDGVQISHYDSNTKREVPKQDWMNQVTAGEPQYWERNTQVSMGSQQTFKVNLGIAKQRFNQTGDGHIYQRMYGCSWDEETGVREGFDQYGYDGEDFIAFDLQTSTWIAPTPQAFITKQKWDRDQVYNENNKHYYTQTCIEWVKKYLQLGEKTLKRTVPPSVSLLQKTPSSPVTCHATGFYPSGVMVFWRRDGQEVFEDVEHGEVLPNDDGTFQKSTRLTLKPEDWEKNQYDCVVQLSGMKDDIVIKLERSVIKTNRGTTDPAPLGLIIGAVVGLLLLASIIITVFFIMKKKRSKKGFSQASTSDDSSNNSAPKA